MALEQAIHNAMLHGNLELSSQTLNSSYQLDDGGRGYQELLDGRRAEHPYRDRKVRISLAISPQDAVCSVQDEGPGFSPPLLTVGAASGEGTNRGLKLMASFMDEVRFNPQGNQVTLVKRRQRAAAT